MSPPILSRKTTYQDKGTSRVTVSRQQSSQLSSIMDVEDNRIKKLKLIVQKNAKKELTKLGYSETKFERTAIADTVLDETMRRLE